MTQPLRALLVDDEPLARQRLAALLAKLDPPVAVVGSVGDAGSALAWLEAHPGQADVCFLDIQMPGPDGLRLAARLAERAERPESGPMPEVVFVTAHAEHALKAFDLAARDYLTKPVRLERLAQAVARCRRAAAAPGAPPPAMATGAAVAGSEAAPPLIVRERDRVIRIPLADILYLKAELKYVTVRTSNHAYVIDESLSELEGRLGDALLRVHRNALVARHAVQRLERRDDSESGEGWAVLVRGTDDWLSVSRRQAPLVREALLSGG
jgi:two-component system response regulator AlgR